MVVGWGQEPRRAGAVMGAGGGHANRPANERTAVNTPPSPAISV